MATMDSNPGSMGSAPAHHLSLPGSPTLTNPDMILPDYPDYDRSPSPVRLDSNRSQSPLTLWKNAQASGATGNMDNILYSQSDQHFRGLSSVAPTTPIIYGNGTMLSDIGEVTEVESTLGRSSPPVRQQSAARISPFGARSVDSESDAALRSSPTMGISSSLSGVRKKARQQAVQRERRSSAGSDSTITDIREQPDLFADVGEAVSVAGDSVFQGDDEESLASSYVDDSDAIGTSTSRGTLPSGAQGQKYTTAQLSRRAEHILANAKRRLTRSSSVLGPPGPRQQPLTGSRSADQLNRQYHRTSYIVRDAQVPLGPLTEDGASQISHQVQLSRNYRHSTNTSPTFDSRSERGLSRSASVTHMADIKDHVKDLKGKISSLREQARADTLKRRSLRGLRTPSPFTNSQVEQWYTGSGPSAQETKYQSRLAESARLIDETASFGRDSAVNVGSDAISNGEDEGAPGVYGHEAVRHAIYVNHGEYESQEALREDGFVEVEDEDDERSSENTDVVVEQGTTVRDAFETLSESGESLYHESYQHQLSHEDREDAFDYEHFFIHSAMGSLSQRMGRRDSETSYGSDGSVETTRGPRAEDVNRRPQLLSRSGSETSISTVASFATAEEALTGRRSTESNSNWEGRAVEDSPEQNAAAGATSTEDLDRPQTARQVTPVGVVSSTHEAADRRSPEWHRRQEMKHSANRRPVSSTGTTRTLRGPSVSSVESTGTARSYPVLKRTGGSSMTGILTPDSGSPRQAVKSTTNYIDTSISTEEVQDGDTVKSGLPSNSTHTHRASLNSVNSTASFFQENGTTAVMDTLPRDDQYLVEKLVVSLGRCVLGMTESDRSSAEGLMYRRRIDAARRVLEGLEEA
ncbi:hypothetical protein SLS53_003150 [Cytospora paraplurivora]|uniref:Uncharacterized protein n=1 Tax=Cytospora paraplurivora TaxID=2898453 RepID=A0AAN9YJA7_9PEZI